MKFPEIKNPSFTVIVYLSDTPLVSGAGGRLTGAPAPAPERDFWECCNSDSSNRVTNWRAFDGRARARTFDRPSWHFPPPPLPRKIIIKTHWNIYWEFFVYCICEYLHHYNYLEILHTILGKFKPLGTPPFNFAVVRMGGGVWVTQIHDDAIKKKKTVCWIGWHCQTRCVSRTNFIWTIKQKWSC